MSMHLHVLVILAVTSQTCLGHADHSNNETHPGVHGVHVPHKPATDSQVSKFLRAEDKLFHDLLDGYNHHLRPEDPLDAVPVQVGVHLVKIIDVSLTHEHVRANMYLTLKWRDARLRWNKSDYETIKTINLPSDLVWRPDIVLFNSLDPIEILPTKADVTVTDDGWLSWKPSTSVKAHCRLDFSVLSMQEQWCGLHFMSWHYEDSQIHYQLLQRTADEIYPINTNEVWNVVDARIAKQKRKYCCPEPHEHQLLAFTFKLRRSIPFYNQVHIAPVVTVTFLLPLLFLLPRRTGNRVYLGGIALVCHTVMLLIVENSLPAHHYGTVAPAQFIISSMVLTTFALFLLAICQRIYDGVNYTRRLPSCLGWITNSCMARCFCVSISDNFGVTASGMQKLATMNGSENDEVGIVEPREESQKIGDFQILVEILERLFFIVFCAVAVILAASYELKSQT